MGESVRMHWARHEAIRLIGDGAIDYVVSKGLGSWPFWWLIEMADTVEEAVKAHWGAGS